MDSLFKVYITACMYILANCETICSRCSRLHFPCTLCANTNGTNHGCGDPFFELLAAINRSSRSRRGAQERAHVRASSYCYCNCTVDVHGWPSPNAFVLASKVVINSSAYCFAVLERAFYSTVDLLELHYTDECISPRLKVHPS